MANTRPYTREELKGLRRANLQNLFKIHNLKGANGTNSILIDSLVEYFASPQYTSAHPPQIPDKEKEKEKHVPARPHSVSSGKIENRYKNLPITTKPIPVKGRVVSGPTRKPVEKDPSTMTTKGSQKKGAKEKVLPTIAAAAISSEDQSGPSESYDAPQRTEIIIRPSLPTPPKSSSSQSHPVSFSQVEALLSANDARWQAKLESLEKNLNDQMERLRLEMSQLRNQLQAQPHAGPSRDTGGSRTWSPWENRDRSASQPLPSASILGKRRQHPLSTAIGGEGVDVGLEQDDDRNESKRVRFNGSKPGDDTPLNEHPPSIIPRSSSFTANAAAAAPPPPPPRTPSPQKTSAFGADYFANPSLTPLPSHSQSSLIPRTPSPSRQGKVPDNSQTPRLPNDWEGEGEDSELSELDDEDMTKGQRTPISRSMIPQFSTTPEPPSHRPISPTMERSFSGSSDRFTPGRVVIGSSATASTPLAQPPSFAVDDANPNGIHLSNVTDLERIDEMDESQNSQHSQIHNQRLISPNGQLNFPTIRPIPRLSGLGTPKSTQPHRIGTGGHQRTISASSSSSGTLLAPPLLIARNSRAGSELPLPTRHRVGSRGLSPPPRPRSANAIHGRDTPPRTIFPLNLPEPEEGSGYVAGGKIRSASADYMHVAMHGLQAGERAEAIGNGEAEGNDGLDFDDADIDMDHGIGKVKKERERESTRMLDIPTPSHRTLLGTERYNDKRFGDIPVSFGLDIGAGESGIWESPR
ncbi:hypothetical protein V865_003494 [Kwoniella europaea PYCC6329]|uniref:SAP domain-containing protein n=1 Tax=Kwoniella europaea PYCC6329 TaxID=1423913 RepID=A0AAX4KFY4_9TREE